MPSSAQLGGPGRLWQANHPREGDDNPRWPGRVGSQRSSDGDLGDLEAEMTSATMKRARGGNRDESYGLVVFAAMLPGIYSRPN